jgi:pyruvate/2-oxoglutarate dehydrogenase complex dihydrolipoamide dehydrogenase (E3) component
VRTTVEIDGPAVMARLHKVIDDGRRFYEELLERNDVLRVRGHARFRDGALVVGDDEGGGETVLRGIPTVLAVGARPWIAPMPGVQGTSFLTSDDLLHLKDLPKSLAVGGAGPIAVEFAQALNRLGVETTLVLRSDSPLRGEEPEARETLLRVLQHEGVRVVTGARRISARDVPGGTEISWIGGSVTAEKVLIATGREPRLDEVDPAEAGIALVDGGALVDANLATTAHGIWALGDAIGGDHRRFQFTHVATYEGPQVAENALRGAHHEPSHMGMPRVTFTDPEVAAVGFTESEALEAGIKVHTCTKLVREVGKARAVGETEGFVKVVIDRATGKLVGATIMAAHAGDMLATLTMPLHIRNGDLGPLLATTFAHPTLSEAVKVAVRDAVASTPAPEAEMTT